MRKILLYNAFIFFVIGDSVTTVYGITQSKYIIEGNTVLHPLVEQSVFIIPIYKTVLFAFFKSISERIREPESYGIMVGLTLLGIILTVWNTAIIFSV